MRHNLVYLALLVSVGCSTLPEQVATPRCDRLATCFSQSGVRSFEVLDRETILVEVGANRCPYLVTLDGIMCDAALVRSHRILRQRWPNLRDGPRLRGNESFSGHRLG